MSKNGDLERYNDLLEEVKQLEALEYDLLKWYNAIGETGFIKAKYSRTNVMALYVAQNKSMSQRDKVRNLLRLKDGVLYPFKKLAHNLQRAYDRLGISKSAKSTDVEQYYKAKKVRQSVRGRQVKGYIVIV